MTQASCIANTRDHGKQAKGGDCHPGYTGKRCTGENGMYVAMVIINMVTKAIKLTLHLHKEIGFTSAFRPFLIEGLVRKPCHENHIAAIYIGRAATVNSPLF